MELKTAVSSRIPEGEIAADNVDFWTMNKSHTAVEYIKFGPAFATVLLVGNNF